MSLERLRATVSLDMSAAQVECLLAVFVDDLRGDNAAARLPIGAPFKELGLPGGLQLVPEVDVTIERRRDEENLKGEFGVTWLADDSTLFPRFDGRLVVRADSASTSYIELDGNYEPPFGGVGEIIDAAIGHAIAQTTARMFVEEVRTGLYRVQSPLALGGDER